MREICQDYLSPFETDTQYLACRQQRSSSTLCVSLVGWHSARPSWKISSRNETNATVLYLSHLWHDKFFSEEKSRSQFSTAIGSRPPVLRLGNRSFRRPTALDCFRLTKKDVLWSFYRSIVARNTSEAKNDELLLAIHVEWVEQKMYLPLNQGRPGILIAMSIKFYIVN